MKLLESALLTYAQVFSHVKELDDQKLFQETFTFLSMLLDEEMAKKNGKVITNALVNGMSSPTLG